MFLALAIFLLPLSFANAATPSPAPLVFIEKVKPAEIFDELSYPARLMPTINATVLSEADGVVQKILAPLGQVVKRNQVIMVMRHTDPVYDYAAVQVRSPVTGVVSSVEVTEGSRVTSGAKLAAITDPSKLKILIEIAVSDLSAIARGARGELRLSDGTNPLPVEVLGLSPYVDPATGTATAELTFVDKKKATPLNPGLVGDVSFKAREHHGLRVPEAAVLYRGQDALLRRVVDGKAKYTPVTLGEIRNGEVEILKGLNSGDSVIVRSSSFVANGETVNVQPLGPGEGGSTSAE